MQKTFLDEDLLYWEAYPSTVKEGPDTIPMIVFHCQTDLHRRARVVRGEGSYAETAHRLAAASDGELRDLLRTAEEVT